MKKIGIVGGVAWLSTVEYYSEICRRSEELRLAGEVEGQPSTPEMAIESLDLAHVLAALGRDGDEASWAVFDAYHRDALRRLEVSGAEVALMASNTPHHRLEAITRGIGIPVVSILEATAKECVRVGAKQALILGMAVAMRSAKFREAFAKHGIAAAGPREEAARAETLELIGELQRDSARHAPERLGRIAKAAFQEQFEGRPLVCLACTELPLAFPDRMRQASFEEDGVVYVNTVAAHVNAVLEAAR